MLPLLFVCPWAGLILGEGPMGTPESRGWRRRRRRRGGGLGWARGGRIVIMWCWINFWRVRLRCCSELELVLFLYFLVIHLPILFILNLTLSIPHLYSLLYFLLHFPLFFLLFLIIDFFLLSPLLISPLPLAQAQQKYYWSYFPHFSFQSYFPFHCFHP